VDDIYKIPMLLHEQGLDEIVVNRLQLNVPPADLSAWHQVVQARAHPETVVDIAMVGKYVQMRDSYISLNEALSHGGIRTRTRVNVHFVESTDIELRGTSCLDGMDAILVPGGFGERGIEGKVEAIRFARERGIPFFGICLGLQCAAIEFARHVVGLEGAQSTEFNKDAPHPVICLLDEQKTITDKGGTMRLGAQPCHLVEGTRSAEAYRRLIISERHRHRYEFNNRYRDQFTAHGMRFSGTSPDNSLVEVIELPEHPWFLAVQYHPEFKSKPTSPQPLFAGFIGAAVEHNKARGERTAAKKPMPKGQPQAAPADQPA
jgi:CTP synthase